MYMRITAALYRQESWNCRARYDSRIGVESLVRLDPGFFNRPDNADNRRLFLSCVAAITVHEMGHDFGLAHCVYYECVMNGCNHLPEFDRAPLFFCPICLRTLHWPIGSDLCRQQPVGMPSAGNTNWARPRPGWRAGRPRTGEGRGG